MTRAQRIQTNIDAISTPIDVEQIKSRLLLIAPGRCRRVDTSGQPVADSGSIDSTYVPRAEWTIDEDFIAHAPADIIALVKEVEALRSEVERLRALIPAPPKTPPPGEVWRHSGARCIDSTEFDVDFIMVGTHTIEAYYPSSNEFLRYRCGYSPHPVIWVDGAIYWQDGISWDDGLVTTEQEEDFCTEVVEALIRYIQEHGAPPDDFGNLGIDTFGRDVGLGAFRD